MASRTAIYCFAETINRRRVSKRVLSSCAGEELISSHLAYLKWELFFSLIATRELVNSLAPHTNKIRMRGYSRKHLEQHWDRHTTAIILIVPDCPLELGSIFNQIFKITMRLISHKMNGVKSQYSFVSHRYIN